MTDLDAIKARVRNAYLLDRDDGDALESAMGDVKTLIAEVERLRAGAAEERAAVVAALRRTSNHGPMGLSLVNLDSIAEAIERGEHRREEER